MNPVRTKILGVSVVVIASLSLAACGSSKDTALTATNAQAAANGADSTTTTAAPAAKPVLLKLASTSTLGDVVTDSNGNVLYAFTKDSDGKSTCNDACATAWPPARVIDTTLTSSGIDPSLISTITRDDGTTQLALNKWPLYRFAADGDATGTTKGQGNKDVWFVLTAEGKLNKTGSAAATTTAAPKAPSTASSKSSSPTAVASGLNPTTGGLLLAAGASQSNANSQSNTNKSNANNRNGNKSFNGESSKKKDRKYGMRFFRSNHNHR